MQTFDRALLDAMDAGNTTKSSDDVFTVDVLESDLAKAADFLSLQSKSAKMELDINTCFDYMESSSTQHDNIDGVAMLSANIAPAALVTPSLIPIQVQQGSNPLKKRKGRGKGLGKSSVQASELDPAKHPIGWFPDDMLHEYVSTIYKAVLEPLADKSPQLVYLMHTTNEAERAAGVFALVSTNKGHFHGARGSQFYRYMFGNLIICHGIIEAAKMVRMRLLNKEPTNSMVTVAVRDINMQKRRAKNKENQDTKKKRTEAKWGSHGSTASKASDYSSEVADNMIIDEQANQDIVPAATITIADLVGYLTKSVIVSASDRKQICLSTTNQGNADGPSTKVWKQQKAQRGGLSASNIGVYTGIILKTQRSRFDTQILRYCRPPGDGKDADDDNSDAEKAIAEATKAGRFLLTTDTPLRAGLAWEPAAGVAHKTYLIALAKKAFEASPDYDKQLWPTVMSNIRVQNCGLLIHKKFNFLCYSPDRSAYCVKESKLIFAEFKLLYKYLGYTLDEVATQFMESMETNPGPTKTLLRNFCLQPVYSTDAGSTPQRWLKDDDGHYRWQVNRNHAYFYQCLAGVNIGDRDCIDFVAITGSSTNGVFIERIYRSDFIMEWKKTEAFAEYLFCNQILQHLTNPLEDDKVRPPVASFEQFTIEKTVMGTNEALTWDKLMSYVNPT